MSGFFSTLFGRGGQREPAPRSLRHPRDLRAGDIIRFHFLDQPDISGKEFEVAQVNTYIYGDLGYPELVLKGRSGELAYLMVEEEDGEEYLAISKKVPKAQISEILGPWDVESIRKAGIGTTVDVVKTPEGLEKWLAAGYREVDDNVKGAFVKGDARELSEEELRRQERFSSHLLEDKSGEYALEIECYETGEIEMSATVYHDVDEIDEMWPGSGAGT